MAGKNAEQKKKKKIKRQHSTSALPGAGEDWTASYGDMRTRQNDPREILDEDDKLEGRSGSRLRPQA